MSGKEIKFKNKTYVLDEEYWNGEDLNSTSQFQYEQLKYLSESKDFITLENRINNMLIWGGLKEL